MAKEHKLKIKEMYARLHFLGRMNWDIRKNDSNFKVGDSILFEIIGTNETYKRKIDYVFEGGWYGLEEGYCILSIS